jgi:competence transcription factor ComK
MKKDKMVTFTYIGRKRGMKRITKLFKKPRIRMAFR